MNRDEATIKLENISGTAWPAPIVRLFVPSVADHIEKYRFHRPPNLSASGTFGLSGNKEATDFSIDVSSPGSMHYDFINEPLTLSRLQSNVRILGDRVDVSNLSFYTFRGSLQRQHTSLIPHTLKNQATLEIYNSADYT